MKHFKLKEFDKSDTNRRLYIDNTPSPQVEERLRQLVDYVLDPLREAYGKPIYVNSGYRCPALNRAVGGVAHSQHLTGEAADITGGNCQENRRLYELLRQLQLPVDQVINEHGFTWLHVSYGPRHRRMFL